MLSLVRGLRHADGKAFERRTIPSDDLVEGVQGQAHYVAAKAGIIGFRAALRGSSANTGSRSMSWRRALRSPNRSRKIPAGAFGSPEKSAGHPRDEVPEDLVGTNFFLASPDADFVAGQMISVDGEKHALTAAGGQRNKEF